jgi:hypothetical protein
MATRNLSEAFENLSDSSSSSSSEDDWPPTAEASRKRRRSSDDDDDEPPAKRPRLDKVYHFDHCYSTANNFTHANVKTLAEMCADCCSKHGLSPVRGLALIFGDRMFCADGDLALLLLFGLIRSDPGTELPEVIERRIDELKTSSKPLLVFGPLVELFPAVRSSADPRGFIGALALVDKLLALGFVSRCSARPDDLVLHSPLVPLSKPYFY